MSRRMTYPEHVAMERALYGIFLEGIVRHPEFVRLDNEATERMARNAAAAAVKEVQTR